MSTTKPDLTWVWAETAPTENVVDPDTVQPGKVSAGWLAEVPPFEYFNYLQQTFSAGLAHANEQGIMIWDGSTTYPVDGIAKGSDGVLYRAVTEQSGNDPTTDGGSNWVVFSNSPISDEHIVTANQASGIDPVNTGSVYARQFLKVIVEGSDTTDYTVTGDYEITLNSGVFSAGDTLIAEQNGNDTGTTELNPLRFSTLADMQASTKIRSGIYLQIDARDSASDGVPALYQSGAGTANGNDVIQLQGSLVATLVDQSGEYSLQQYGGGDDAQAAFDRIQDKAVKGEMLTIGSGEFVGNFATGKTPIKGVGASSILKSDAAGTVLQLNRHIPDWDYYRIENVTIDGNNKASIGAQFDPANALAGRWVFDNVQFLDCSTGVDKPSGNIGDQYNRCTWSDCDYAYRTTDDPNPMHGGSVTFTGSHFDRMDLACFHADDATDGSGGYVIRDSIMEQCDGFGVFMDLHEIVPFTPPSFQNLWMEGVAQAATVTIDAVVYTPRQYRFKDAPFASIKESYLYNVELINSTVHAENVRIDDAYDSSVFVIDAASQLIVDDLYGNGQVGEEPFVRSIARQTSTSNTKNLSVRGPLKRQQIELANVSNATDISSNSYSGAGPWSFGGTSPVNATSVSDGVLNATCAEITIPDGNTNLGAEQSTPTPGKWAVWSIHAKLTDGVFSTARIGYNWTAGTIYLRLNQWVCSYGIQKVGSTVNTVRIQLVNSSGADATVRLADYSLVEFDTFEEATEFANAGYSIKNEI